MPQLGNLASDTWGAWNITYTAVTTTVSNAANVIWTAWNDTYTATTANTTSYVEIPSTSSVATTNLIWSAWNETYILDGNQAISQYNQVLSRNETPEQAARRAQEAETYRQRQIAAEGERAKARERAAKLLQESLSPKQREQLQASGFFELETIRPDGERRTYRIRRGRSRNIQQVDASGRVLKTICAHPVENVPDEDTMLAQKLWLESKEEEFLRIANHS